MFVLYLYIQRQLWGGLIGEADILFVEDDISGLAVYPCPEGYCQCQDVEENICFYAYNSSSPDTQCTCSRKGKLLYLYCKIIMGVHGIHVAKYFAVY